MLKQAMKVSVNEAPTDPLQKTAGGQYITYFAKLLHEYQAKIQNNPADSVEDRWRFGRVLLEYCGEEKKMPVGLSRRLTDEFGISTREVQRRLQFAKKVESKEQLSAVLGNYSSWCQIYTLFIPSGTVEPRTGGRGWYWVPPEVNAEVLRLAANAGLPPEELVVRAVKVYSILQTAMEGRIP